VLLLDEGVRGGESLLEALPDDVPSAQRRCRHLVVHRILGVERDKRVHVVPVEGV